MIRLEAYKKAMQEFNAAGNEGEFPLVSQLPQQRPSFFYPGLDSRVLHDPKEFEWVTRLEAAWPEVVAELDRLRQRREGFVQVYKDYTDRGAWAACYLWIFGHRVNQACDLCPRTSELLTSIPGVTEFGTALFSALGPKTRLATHCGITNTKLRCHLPLKVPTGCGLRIAEHDITLQEGRGVVFDDSFFHTAWNDSAEPRYVLLFDFFHPGLSTDETDFLLGLVRKRQPHRFYLEGIEKGFTPDWVYD